MASLRYRALQLAHAKKAGAIPFGAGDCVRNARQAPIGRSVPNEAVIHYGHLVGRAAPFAQQNGASSRERCRYGFGRIRPVVTKHTCKDAVEFLCERFREPAMAPFLP